MKIAAGLVLLILVASVGIVAMALVLGGPSRPAAMKDINAPFSTVDYRDLPELSHYPARDGSQLAYRHYPPTSDAAKGSVVLLHGSAGNSRSLHPLAKAHAAAGFMVYSLDVRGHGASGTKGDIAYIGQLENDLKDFLATIAPARPRTLVGFSSGGGFALRVAGSQRQRLFDHYLLLAPFISQEAPTHRPDSGGWTSVGLPRYIALTLLDRLGINAFHHLPVMRYAVDDDAAPSLTTAYSFTLAQNYRPKPDYRATLKALDCPMQVLVGQDDQIFRAEQFDPVFQHAGRHVPIKHLPGIDHIGLILDPAAIDATVDATQALNGQGNCQR
ncbi:alpha/beta hydrolase [Halomonas caseinilytica]|uniref:alpha/beta hydrolase n=1 Tax=Halomonas caseinilytica TaxID=438744 RepID=UPI0009F45C0D|nr:alpha/beta fold hydrolase [Halomonas caseinilytica]